MVVIRDFLILSLIIFAFSYLFVFSMNNPSHIIWFGYTILSRSWHMNL